MIHGNLTGISPLLCGADAVFKQGFMWLDLGRKLWYTVRGREA